MHPPKDRSDFHRRQRKRFRDEVPRLEGAFAVKAIEELKGTFRSRLANVDVDASHLVDVLEEGAVKEALQFVSALYRASRKSKPTTDLDRRLFSEWLVYAVCCSIDLEVWLQLQLPVVEEGGESCAVPVASGLLTMMAVAGSQGRPIHLTSNGDIQGHIDLERVGIGDGSPAEHVKGALYDRVFELTEFARGSERGSLDDEQVRRLRAHYRMTPPGEFEVITLALSGDGSSQSATLAICESLATELPALFVANADTNTTSLDDLHDRCNLALGRTKRPSVQERRTERTSFEFDVFICHASEDKKPFVTPLYDALKNKGLSVWYDVGEIDRLGGDFIKEMNEGIKRCQHGVIVASPTFRRKHYATMELSGWLAVSKDHRRRVMPLLFQLNRETFESDWPLLAGKTNEEVRDASQVDALAQVIADIVAKYKGA